jgi:hypothetical protein
MPYRGYFAINGVEIVNSARTAAHLGMSTPTSDAMVWGSNDCTLTPIPGDPGLYQIPASSVLVTAGLYSPPDGSARYDPGLIEVGECWTPSDFCSGCRHPVVMFDDTWSGLQAFLGDTVYRPELAPWFMTDAPESGEFGGVWVLDANGFGPVPISRPVTELVGAGGAAGPHRDTSRVLTFTAVLAACSNAGLEYGVSWLDCQLRETKDRTDSVLQYLTAHPDGSAATPNDLRRELHGVLLTKHLTIDAESGPHRQATMCRVTWELTALHPYSYTPPVTVPVVFDRVETQPIEWVHGAGCDKPGTCDPMPTLFNQDCIPETIDIVATPPPTCGGCLPVCGVLTCVFVLDGPYPAGTRAPSACRPTAVSWTITNNSATQPLTAQTFWRSCAADPECDDALGPTQITGLPPAATLTFDAVTRRYWAAFLSHPRRHYRPVGMVSTPSGSPWEPTLLDRSHCWEFVVLAPDGSDFEVQMSLYDREA